MAEDIVKPIGPTKASKNDASGGVLRSEPVIATVKNNVDPIRQGRLQVYVDDLNSPNPDDSNAWVTVSFMSPFYGKTPGTGSNTGYGAYSTNPISYGEWHSPPDIGTKVICIFINGDPNYGYYIGCVPEPEALVMVPAIGAVDAEVTMNSGESKSLAGATFLPVTNLNSDNEKLANSNKFLTAPKPVHSYVASVLSQQGILRDPIRGPITSSSQRESPSRVGWGVSTPGRPIYEGGFTDETVADAAGNPGQQSATQVVSRRAGHTFVMDDGDLLGKDQLIRLRTALGHQILMSDDGQCLFIIHANGQSWIELGKEGTIDMFSTNSVNIRTQGDLNLHADNDINIHAENNLNINAQKNININSEKETNVRTGTDFKQYVLNNYTVKVDAGMSMESQNDASYASSGTTFINGSLVHLNTGATSLTPQSVDAIPLIAQVDTLFDSEKGFAPAPAKLETIVTRAPAHMPWPMANKGVDVKVDQNADSSLPAAPSDSVQDVNDSVPSLPDVPASASGLATVPNLGSPSDGLNPSTSTSLVGAAAAQASALNPTAVLQGSAIVGNKPIIGQLAQSATQMTTGGALKPGSDVLIDGLISKGASVKGAMTNNLFTNKSGVTNLDSFINNTAAQVQSQITNLAQAQSKLQASGVINGNENPGAIAGVIMAGAQNGIDQTVNFVKQATSATGALAATASKLGGSVSALQQNISAGNFASNLGTNASGALGALSDTLDKAVDSATGPVTSAFKAIVGGYKSFTPNLPQNLRALASQGAGSEASASQADNPIGSLVTNSVADVASAAKNFASSASGLQGIPGGANAFSSFVDNGKDALNKIPGTDALAGVMNSASTALTNNIPTSVAAASSFTQNITGAGTALMSQAQNTLSQGLASAGSLLAGAQSLLPKDLSAQLNSAISALSSSSPIQIKTPIVAENTLDRSGFASQVSSILGNPKIPTPNYVGPLVPSSYYETEVKKLEDAKKKRAEISAKIDEQKDITLKIRDEYQSAIDNYPPGDPAIVEQREKYYAAKAKWAELINEFANT